MKQVVKLKIPKEHYRADVCILWCIDARFSRLDDSEKSLLIKFIQTFGFKNPDVIIAAGGAKGLADYGSGTSFILGQLETSIKLHQPPLIALVIHRDCGAYGKISAPDENKFFNDQLKKAKHRVSSFLETINSLREIKMFFADFDGLWEADQD